MYDTIVFDLDGTLLNTLKDLCNSTNFALNKYGFKERTLEEVRTLVGSGAAVLIKRALPEGVDDKIYSEVLATFKEHYREHSNDLTAPYEGVLDMLEEVKKRGYKTAILSNKPHNAVCDLHKLFFEKYIDVPMGVKDGIPTKPNPQMVENVLKELASAKEKTLYVGDSEVDVQTAANSKLDMVTCLWGFRSEEELKANGAGNFIKEPMELLGFLE